MADKPTLTIALTPEQQKQIRQATGKAAFILKLQPLEARLAPSLSSN